MKLKITILSFLAATMLSQGQNVFLAEHFNYPADTLIRDFGWNSHSAATTNPIRTTASGLSWTQTAYLGSGVGNAAAVNNTGSDENKNLTSYVDSGDVYISFLARVNNEVTSTNSGFFLHTGQYSNTSSPVFTSTSSAFRARTFIAPGATGAKFKFGISFNTTSPNGTTADLDTGVTYLVVVKYSFVPGTANDSVSLFVFADGDMIQNEPAVPSAGPFAGTQGDMDVCQYVALRQYNAGQNITVDGIIVQDSWNMLPTPLAGSTLLSPPNATQLFVNGNGGTQANITWTQASNATAAVSYQWQFALKAVGNFNNPALVLPSNNSGADTVLTLSFSQIDAVLASLGVMVGDTVEGMWRVMAVSGTDTTYSTNTFDIDIIRGLIFEPISGFNLLSPASQAIVLITGSPAQLAQVTWSSASAGTVPVDYEWIAVASGGNLSNPLLTLASNNMGADTALSLSFLDVYNLLTTLGLSQGDSIKLDWTVRANADTSSRLANQTWQITLVKGSLTSVDEFEENSSIVLFPNPAKDRISLKFESAIHNNLKISLINSLGQQVDVLDRPEFNGNTLSFEVKNQPNGLYFIRIENGVETTQLRLLLQK